MQEKNFSNTEGVAPGVYVAIKVDKLDIEKVLFFCENDLSIDMKKSASPYASVKEGMHATLLAAKDPKNQTQESVQKHLSVNEFEATPSHWEIFTSPNSGKKCLVLKLESPQMKDFHEKLKQETGLKHSFDDFTLHVSVHYDYNGEIPKKIPNFNIKFKETFTKPYHFIQKVTDIKEQKQITSEYKTTVIMVGVTDTTKSEISNNEDNALDFSLVLDKVKKIKTSLFNMNTTFVNTEEKINANRPKFK